MARGVDKKKRDRIMDYVQSKKRFVGQEEILRELQMDKNDIRLCFIYAKKNIPVDSCLVCLHGIKEKAKGKKLC